MEVRNVNRVLETPGLKLEKELLARETEAQSQPETVDSSIHVLPIPPIPAEAWKFIEQARTEFRVPPNVGATVVLQPGQKAIGPTPMTVEAQRAEQVGRTEKINEALATLPDMPSFGQLAKFRKEVISAFKHLGLDVNKFFGAQ